MIRIGLLSDTHGFLDEKVFEYFAECDQIWHVGDFGPTVAEKLTEFKPLRGVWGNIDGQEIRKNFPKTHYFSCEGVKVMMVHIGGYPGRYAPGVRQVLMKEKPTLFISGHSHILKVMNDKALGLLHINPGAAGREGFHNMRTLIRFSITDNRIHDLEVIELGKR